jgi:hypothetical protein
MRGTATKNTFGLWCKKLVVKALKGSFMIWDKASSETFASNNRKSMKAVQMMKTIMRKKDK